MFAAPVIQPARGGVGIGGGFLAKRQRVVREVQDLCAHSGAHRLRVGWTDGGPSARNEPSGGVVGEGKAVGVNGISANTAVKDVVQELEEIVSG